MRTFLRNALIGAILGGGVAAVVNATRSPAEAAEDADPTMVIVRGATFGAVGAVALGWLRGRRAERRAAKARAQEPAVMRLVHDVVDEVGPRVEDGIERLGEVAGAAREAAGAARDRAESLIA